MESAVILQIGEFKLSQYTDGSLLITKDSGESMEISLETLRNMWDWLY
uniref:Uncharacterized protein n=1 Tax=viral metagenome TaxID=1070528 RepID=A0A6M3LVT0_9ZZZZ